jgi:hypothetical protein
MIKSPKEYRNFCPGYFLSLSIVVLTSLAKLITQANAAPMKYTVSEETLNLPHQHKSYDCQEKPLNSTKFY